MFSRSRQTISLHDCESIDTAGCIDPPEECAPAAQEEIVDECEQNVDEAIEELILNQQQQLVAKIKAMVREERIVRRRTAQEQDSLDQQAL